MMVSLSQNLDLSRGEGVATGVLRPLPSPEGFMETLFLKHLGGGKVSEISEEEKNKLLNDIN